jgi:hypothetical protein
MADRTHEDEDTLTQGRTDSGSKAQSPAPSAGGVYQEGRVDRIGGGPSGTDRDDRSGEGEGRGVTRGEEGRSPDEFVSTEVNERSARPGHPIKTRG